jgi:hypothetical protein
VFSGHLSLALAHRSAQGGENDEGKESSTVKQRLANWFAGQRPRTAKVRPLADSATDASRTAPIFVHVHNMDPETPNPKPQTETRNRNRKP